MEGRPSLLLSGCLLIFSGCLIILAIRVPEQYGWLKAIMLVIAGVTGFYGLAQLILWFTYAAQDVKERAVFVAREAAESKYPVVFANALAGLPGSAVDVIGRSTTAEIFGIMDDQFNLQWRIRAPGIDVDYLFALDYIKASKSTAPYLWPVNQTYGLGNYPNAERMAASFTTLLVNAGWADPAAGNNSARLLVPWRQLADKFGLED